MLGQNQPDQALQAFKSALVAAPRRRGGLVGAIAAAERLGDARTANQLRPLLQ
jgi:hypothetical protein